MTYAALHPNGEGPEVERCSCSPRAACEITRGHAAPCFQLRAIAPPGISVSAASLPAETSRRSSRGHGADHVEAPAAHRRTAAEACQKQWPDDGVDRDRCIASFPANKEEAWLSRAKKAALWKFTLTMSLIACSSRSSARPTIFWFPVESAL
jgi:hypothetical protein